MKKESSAPAFESSQGVRRELIRRDRMANEPQQNRHDQAVASMVAFHMKRLRTLLDSLNLVSPENAQQQRRLLSELLPPKSGLVQDFHNLLKTIHERQTPIRNDDPVLWDQWHSWIERLQTHLSSLNAPDELTIRITDESQALFEAIIVAINSRSLIKEVDRFKKTNQKEFEQPKKRADVQVRLEMQLAERYPYSKSDIHTIVNLLLKEKPGSVGEFRELLQVLQKLWTEYGLKEVSEKTAQFSIGLIAGILLKNQLPSLMGRFQKGERFELAAYLEYHLARLAEIGISDFADLRLEEMQSAINQTVNRKLIESIFFRELEFGPDASDHEILETLGKGQHALRSIVYNTATRLVPAAATVALSAYRLTRMHPLLATAGLIGMPFIVAAEQRIDEEHEKIHEAQRKTAKDVRQRLDAYKIGLEHLKTTPDAQILIDRILDLMNTSESEQVEAKRKRFRLSVIDQLPRLLSGVLAAAVGTFLQRSGRLTAKEVQEGIRRLEESRNPLQTLLRLYYEGVSDNLRMIREMEALFGDHADTDKPDGPMEKARKPMSSLPNHTISIENLWYSRQIKRERRPILRGASFEIPEGTFTVLAGLSGSGKSTLIRHITDLLHAEYGSVRIGNAPIETIKKYGDDSLYASMAYASQNRPLFPSMSVRENLTIWIPTKQPSEKQIISILHSLGLHAFVERLDEPLSYASGGEAVRLNLARALLKLQLTPSGNPRILLLDEPTSGLDPKTEQETNDLIAEIHAKDPQLTVVCITHDEQLIEQAKTAPKNSRLRLIQMEDVQQSAA